MDISMQLPEPVQWWEGMPLSPQHLQQNDIYWHQQLRHRAASLQPYYWGVVDFALSPAALLSGVVAVERLHCVMPDGMVVQYPGFFDKPLRVDLNTACEWTDGKVVKVHLAVPVRTEGAASSTSSIQRYDSVPGALEIDENTGESRVPVERLRPRVSLVVGDTVPAKYTAFPLLEVRRDPGSHFKLTAFHPPMLRADASAFLGDNALQEELLALLHQIRGKAKELADDIGSDGGDLEAVGADARRHLYAVRHLIMALPPLEVLAASRVAHPFDLYLALAQLVGHVAAIGADPIPLRMEAYRHDDFMPGFLAARDYVEAKLDRLTLAFESRLFDQDKDNDNLFSCALPEGMSTNHIIVELKPRPGHSIAELAGWLGQAMIASDDLIPILQQRRLLGATVMPVKLNQIVGLNVREGRAFFQIDNQTIQVKERVVPAIRRGRPLVIQGSVDAHAHRPAAIAMYRAKTAPQSGGTR